MGGAVWRWSGGAVVVQAAARSERRRGREDDAGESAVRRRGQDIYDMWTPRFFLTPVDPMPRFRTWVKSTGAVVLRLQQKHI